MIGRTDSDDINEVVKTFLDCFPIEQSDCVLIKPNFVSMDSYPFTTERKVIEEVVRYLLDKGVIKIIVADSPSPDYSAVFNLPCNDEEKKNRMNEFHQVYRRTQCKEEELAYITNIKKQVKEYYDYFFEQPRYKGYAGSIDAMSLFDLPDLKMCSLRISDEIEAKCFDVSEFDWIINLPVLKLHTTAGFTGAVKNFYGLLSMEDKLKMHKYSAISVAITSVMTYLEKYRVITLLDCRNIPSSQQRIWGDGTIYKGTGWIYGDNLYEVDKMAIKYLEIEGIPIGGKDLNYFECLKK